MDEGAFNSTPCALRNRVVYSSIDYYSSAAALTSTSASMPLPAASPVPAGPPSPPPPPPPPPPCGPDTAPARIAANSFLENSSVEMNLLACVRKSDAITVGPINKGFVKSRFYFLFHTLSLLTHSLLCTHIQSYKHSITHSHRDTIISRSYTASTTWCESPRCRAAPAAPPGHGPKPPLLCA